MSLDFANVWLFDERSKIPVQRSSILCERSEFRSERSSGRTFAHGRPPERSLRNCERSKPGPGFDSCQASPANVRCSLRERSLRIRTFAREGGTNVRENERSDPATNVRRNCANVRKNHSTQVAPKPSPPASTCALHLCFPTFRHRLSALCRHLCLWLSPL